jgi:hypothetical protein
VGGSWGLQTRLEPRLNPAVIFDSRQSTGNRQQAIGNPTCAPRVRGASARSRFRFPILPASRFPVTCVSPSSWLLPCCPLPWAALPPAPGRGTCVCVESREPPAAICDLRSRREAREAEPPHPHNNNHNHNQQPTTNNQAPRSKEAAKAVQPTTNSQAGGRGRRTRARR